MINVFRFETKQRLFEKNGWWNIWTKVFCNLLNPPLNMIRQLHSTQCIFFEAQQMASWNGSKNWVYFWDNRTFNWKRLEPFLGGLAVPHNSVQWVIWETWVGYGRKKEDLPNLGWHVDHPPCWEFWRLSSKIPSTIGWTPLWPVLIF